MVVLIINPVNSHENHRHFAINLVEYNQHIQIIAIISIQFSIFSYIYHYKKHQVTSLILPLNSVDPLL
jgi:hypothetical protein